MTTALAIEFCIEHRFKIAAALAVLFWALALKGCSDAAANKAALAACLSKPAERIEAAASVSQTVKTVTRVQIVYKNAASPCPDVAVDTTSDASQAATATASIEPPKGSVRQVGPWSLSLGTAHYRGGFYGSIGGGYWINSPVGELGIESALLFPWAWEESQITRRPAVTLGLTVRP